MSLQPLQGRTALKRRELGKMDCGYRSTGRRTRCEIHQAHAYWTIGNAFNADLTRSDGELGEELMRRSVLAAEALGVKWMVVHPYTVRRNGGGYDYRKSFEYNKEYMKHWGEIFADHHVGMAIENMTKPTHYGSCAENCWS